MAKLWLALANVVKAVDNFFIKNFEFQYLIARQKHFGH